MVAQLLCFLLCMHLLLIHPQSSSALYLLFITCIILLFLLCLHQADCASLGASLVSVHNLEEYSFLFQQTTASGSSAAWLGGFYLDVRQHNNTFRFLCTVDFT